MDAVAIGDVLGRHEFWPVVVVHVADKDTIIVYALDDESPDWPTKTPVIEDDVEGGIESYTLTEKELCSKYFRIGTGAPRFYNSNRPVYELDGEFIQDYVPLVPGRPRG